MELAPRPRIPDTEACMQSQAAALSVSPPEERSLLFYRKGYCAFAGGAATNDPRRFLAAAAASNKESKPGRRAHPRTRSTQRQSP